MRILAVLLVFVWCVSSDLFVPFPTTINVIAVERKQIAVSLLQTKNPVRFLFVRETTPQVFLKSDEGRRYALAKI